MKNIVKIQKTVAWVEIAELSIVSVLVGQAYCSYRTQLDKEQFLCGYMPSCYYQCQKPHIGWREIQLDLAGVTTSSGDGTITIITPFVP